MTKRAVLLLDDHPGSLTVVEAALRRRYGQDYLIISQASAQPPSATWPTCEMPGGR